MSTEQLLDAALTMLVSFQIDIVCDQMHDVGDWCEKHCEYDCPQKECYKRYFEMKEEQRNANARI